MLISNLDYLVKDVCNQKVSNSLWLAQQRLDYNTGGITARKDKLYRAYAYLQAVSNSSEISSSQTAKLLRTFEIPRFIIKNEERTRRTARGDRPKTGRGHNPDDLLSYRKQIDDKLLRTGIDILLRNS